MIDDIRPLFVHAQKSPAQNCLEPLLNALSWTGGPRRLYEALPEDQVISDLPALLRVLKTLHLRAVPDGSKGGDLGNEALPALLSREDGDVWVIVEAEKAGYFSVFKGRQGRLAVVSARELEGRIFLICPAEIGTTHEKLDRFGWLTFLLEVEPSLMRTLLYFSFPIGCVALALPIYVMLAADLAIGGGALLAMTAISGGMAAIVGVEIILRELRARSIAEFAVRVHTRLAEAAFDRIANMPLAAIEAVPAAVLMERLRAFEAIRDIFATQIIVALIDLPFIVFLLMAAFVIGGWLGVLIVGLVIVMAGLSVVFAMKLRLKSHNEQIRRLERRRFRADMTANLSVVQSSHAEEIWERRYSRLVLDGISADAGMRRIANSNEIMLLAAAVLTAASSAGFGAISVVDGELSIGALVALLVIIWRILTPIHAVLLNIDAMFQLMDIGRQFKKLMRLPRERSHSSAMPHKNISGRINLENAGYHGKDADQPLLRNIALTAERGELVALTGRSALTRDALFRVIANLYQPDSGRIRIDGLDARQFDLRELRQSIALVSEDQHLFPGSLSCNFRLVNPFADDDQCRAAIRDADLQGFVSTLDDGMETDLSDRLRAELTPGVCGKLRLARAYVQNPAIYLFDEPLKDLDASGRRAFITKLIELKGKKTVVIGTSDHDILSLADKVAHLKAGQIARLDVRPPDPAGSKAKSLRALLEKRQTSSSKRSASA